MIKYLRERNLFTFNKIQLKLFFIEKIIFFKIVLILMGCSDKNWKDFGDSCIQISESPPLKRLINYTDHDLCDRKLSPRAAPNSKIRFQ